MAIVGIVLFAGCLGFIAPLVGAQAAPATGTPAATTAPGATPTPAALKACPASYGFLGPISSSAAAPPSGGIFSSAQPVGVSVQQTNNAAAAGAGPKAPIPPTGVADIAHLKADLNATDVATSSGMVQNTDSRSKQEFRV